MTTHLDSSAHPANTATRNPRGTERTVWWVVFSVLTLSIVLMLGAWD